MLEDKAIICPIPTSISGNLINVLKYLKKKKKKVNYFNLAFQVFSNLHHLQTAVFQDMAMV